MIRNRHHSMYHLQPAVPAVHTSIQRSHRPSLLPNTSPTWLVGGTAGGSVELSVIPLYLEPNPNFDLILIFTNTHT